MTREETALLQLIRNSQFDSPIDFSWDDIDMSKLYKEASQQSVLGLIAPLIPTEYSNDNWRKAQLNQESSYIKYCYAQDELKQTLDEAHIPFVILKGNSAAISYKKPMHRAMGDIDFLVPQEQFDEARAALLEAGYKEGHESGRHLAFDNGKTHLEFHHRFSHEIDIEDYLIEGLKNPEINEIDGHVFPMLPRLANGLVLLDHMRNHLKSALGLRQMIDWMMYVNCNLDDDFWANEFGPVARAKGMATLAITATRMCQIYLGLPNTITWCNNADEDTCREFIEVLLITGNFGRKNGLGSSVETVTTSIKRMGLFHWLQYAGELNWEAYHKHHWLKPFCWLYQIGRYAKQGIESGRNPNQLKSDFNRSDKRYELLKRLGIN